MNEGRENVLLATPRPANGLRFPFFPSAPYLSGLRAFGPAAVTILTPYMSFTNSPGIRRSARTPVQKPAPVCKTDIKPILIGPRQRPQC
jgi:hypothetical protein